MRTRSAVELSDLLITAAKAEERKSRLTTADCARVLGMTTAFVRGEIRDKRLPARVFKPEGRKYATYSVRLDDLMVYVSRYWRMASEQSE